MKYILSLLTVFLLFSCQETASHFTKHEMGFEYQFHKHDETASKPKMGDILVLDMDYYYNGDSLLFSTKELGRIYRMKLKKNKPTGETIDDALAMMHVGDSASFKVNANLYYTLTKQQDVPVKVKQDDNIVFHIKLKSIIDRQKYQEEKTKKEKTSPEEEEVLLKRYLKMANISVKPTNSGLYFVEDIKGEGPKAKSGQEVTLHYSGYFINGKSFSSTYESGQPFTFVLGQTDLIAGFEEGISLMQKKGRYTLVIPSHIAYGKEGNDRIPQNKTLIFEINLLDIK